MSVADTLIKAQPAPPDRAKRWTTARISGTILVMFWVLAAIGLVLYLYSAWDIAKIERYGPKFLSGLWTTLSLVGVSIAIGAVISLPVALGRVSKNPVISRIAFAYVYVFRGTPLIAQLFLIYYGLHAFLIDVGHH